MPVFRNIILMKWIFVFFLSVGLTPVLILAEISKDASLLFPYVKFNFYLVPSTNDQPENDSISITEEFWNSNASIPDNPHNCLDEQTIPCDPTDPYRTIDGSCNNLIHPKWGAVDQCYLRFQPASYEGFESFRKLRNGDPLPLARGLTDKIFKEVHRPSPNVSFMFTIYGQSVAHDFSRAENKNTLTNCCKEKEKKHPSCMELVIKPDDSFYSQYNVSCLKIHRSKHCDICNTTSREQVNAVTPALDLSLTYGTSEKRQTDLRTMDGTGKMKVASTKYGDLLPTDDDLNRLFCRDRENLICFFAGDVRINQHALLSCIQTYYVREHNRIATKLKTINPHWEGEKLFQEAKRINNAIVQCITYKEYLPALLGPNIVEKFNLTFENGSNGSKYNPEVRLEVRNEFATAAFRLHSMIPATIGTGDLKFRNMYSKPIFLQSGQLEKMVEGTYKVPSEEYNQYHVNDVTKYMFVRPGNEYGFDLGSFDVQRGRDHGMPPYVRMVEFCSEGRVKITSFDELAPLLMAKEKAEILKKSYAAVEDIDLVMGMLMENIFPGSAVGPTASCIIAMQFYYTKFGDRYFFEHEGEAPSFTADQRNSLKQCSLSRVLCDNSNITHILKNVMLLPSATNPEVSCEDIPEIDLNLWTETPSSETISSLDTNSITEVSIEN